MYCSGRTVDLKFKYAVGRKKNLPYLPLSFQAGNEHGVPNLMVAATSAAIFSFGIMLLFGSYDLRFRDLSFEWVFHFIGYEPIKNDKRLPQPL